MAKEHQHTVKELIDGLIGYLSASGGLLAFGVDIVRAFVLGVVGVFGSVLGRWIYNKFFKKNGGKN